MKINVRTRKIALSLIIVALVAGILTIFIAMTDLWLSGETVSSMVYNFSHLFVLGCMIFGLIVSINTLDSIR